ncbi:MAG: polymer-forming cytoskeletal protein [Bacteroidia bacterium]|nr:polymer-forming cytoskeletal protein [Bacteroidia bacterium]
MSKNEVTTQVNDVNRISSGTEFHGVLNSNADIRIDGFFEGKITTTGKLVIGDSARMVGEAIAKSCDIWGEMEGKVLLKEFFGLRKTGTFKGKVACHKVFIEDGGYFNGSCKIITPEEFEGSIKALENDGKEIF